MIRWILQLQKCLLTDFACERGQQLRLGYLRIMPQAEHQFNPGCIGAVSFGQFQRERVVRVLLQAVDMQARRISGLGVPQAGGGEFARHILVEAVLNDEYEFLAQQFQRLHFVVHLDEDRLRRHLPVDAVTLFGDVFGRVNGTLRQFTDQALARRPDSPQFRHAGGIRRSNQRYRQEASPRGRYALDCQARVLPKGAARPGIFAAVEENAWDR